MVENLFDSSVLVVTMIAIYSSSVLFGVILSGNFDAIRRKLFIKSQLKNTDKKDIRDNSAFLARR